MTLILRYLLLMLLAVPFFLEAGQDPPVPTRQPLGEPGRDILFGLAEAGRPQAQALLGEMYLHGTGVPRDQAAARRWFQAAAERGEASAQRNLGLLYQAGIGGEADPEQAAHWLQRAWQQGDPYACYKLGGGYLQGGVP